jgi:enamine deaminase RidA (YjgF/YER057c/UK114 family)
MNVYDNLKKLGLELPPPPPKGGIYKPVKQVGNLLYVSGQGATKNGVSVLQGKLGRECNVGQGQQAAQLCALNALSVLNDFLGDLNQVKSLVKMLAFVASADGFGQQPLVANGASQLLLDVFGEEGVGARSAIGVKELPGNIPVEIEFVFEK